MKNLHANSLFAFAREKEALSARAIAILATLEKSGPMTDRQVLSAMGFSDMNQVRPRITELKKAGQVFECGQTKCPLTGMTVRIVSAR